MYLPICLYVQAATSKTLITWPTSEIKVPFGMMYAKIWTFGIFKQVVIGKLIQLLNLKVRQAVKKEQQKV